MTRDRFPIQGGLTVSWEAAEQAYKGYVSRFGRCQTLERLAERGGFGIMEFVKLFSYDRPWARRDQDPTEVEIASALSKGDVRSVQSVGTGADIPMDVEAVRRAVGAPPGNDAGLVMAIQRAEDMAHNVRAGSAPKGMGFGAEGKDEEADDYQALVAFLKELRRRRQDDDQADTRHPSLRVTSETVVRLGRVIRTLAFALLRVAEDGASMTSHAVREDRVYKAVKEWTSSSHIDWLYPPDHLARTLQGD